MPSTLIIIRGMSIRIMAPGSAVTVSLTGIMSLRSITSDLFIVRLLILAARQKLKRPGVVSEE